MNRIERAFRLCREQGRKALVAFVSAGDPDLEATRHIVATAAEAGADLIELGVPFSDPMADGPTIQEASQRALRSGTTLDTILETVRQLRRAGVEVPLILFSYYNVLLQYGLERLAADASGAGIDGVLVVDVPFEEMAEIEPVLERSGLAVIRLLAPTTPADRVRRIVAEARGFVYCITVTGVTGVRSELPADLSAQLDTTRRLSPVPVVAGFGISTPEMARLVAVHADGVVVGSALVRRLAEAPTAEARLRECRDFVGGLAAALRES
ncbi:MAG: tryptophan synthase subunit alpha [Lentisphaeria bacterium]|nr:tryptophan synthase subunit alpha [Lentisphaeria bacterium]